MKMKILTKLTLAVLCAALTFSTPARAADDEPLDLLQPAPQEPAPIEPAPALFYGSRLAPRDDKPAPPQAGDTAPDFTATDLHGNTLSLTDLRGRVVLLNFWASWCAWCVAEMPDLQRVAQHYDPDELALVTINVEDATTARAFFKKNKGYRLRTVVDTEARIAGQYGIEALPTSFVLDKAGKVAHRLVGAQPAEQFQEAIAQAGDTAKNTLAATGP